MEDEIDVESKVEGETGGGLRRETDDSCRNSRLEPRLAVEERRGRRCWRLTA